MIFMTHPKSCKPNGEARMSDYQGSIIDSIWPGIRLFLIGMVMGMVVGGLAVAGVTWLVMI